jgi:hypothetical protein
MKRKRGLFKINKSRTYWWSHVSLKKSSQVAILLFASLLFFVCASESLAQQPLERNEEVGPKPSEETALKQIVEVSSESEKKTEGVDPESAAERHSMQGSGSAPVTEETQEPQREIPGVAFTEKLIELLDYELNGRFLGWRPNDLLIGRFTDNVKESQLGALEAIRYTAVKLKESLTRFGDADAYDPKLVEAVNLLMNRADQYWFPSSESQYELALAKLRAFLTNLKTGKTRFYYRTENLIALIAYYKDLLGNCHENLIKEIEPDGSRVSHFQADNYFYYCQGVAKVMYEILKTVRRGFVEQLQTLDAVALMEKIIEDLGHASKISPWLITNSDADDILANHRYNLAAPISSALHHMSTMLKYK